MIKVTVFTESVNSRIEYALKIVLRVVLGVDYQIVSGEELPVDFQGILINYSEKKIDNSFQIIPHGLLHEKKIRIQEIEVSRWKDLPVFFQTPGTGIPFDLFSAVFYLTTRYEEYLPYTPDYHGRFQAEESLAFRNEFLRLPIVDIWSVELARLLGIADKCQNIQSSNYDFKLTIDIDYPWSYLHRGIVYSIGALVKKLITFQFKECWNNAAVLMRKRQDPGDNYSLFEAVDRRLGHPIKYFVLCRRKKPFDRNIAVGKNTFHDLLLRLDRQKKVYIHPSYASVGDISLLTEEISYLSRILRRKIEAGRQHYLNIRLPETYRALIKHEILSDYSMGFPSQTGFRTGITRSFNFYDLLAEKETKLRIYPFQVMDRTLLSYMKLNPEEAIKEYEYYTDIIRSVGGEFISLWHNDSLSDYGEWKGWRKVFEKMVEMNEYI